jgi:hypothetical protein
VYHDPHALDHTQGPARPSGLEAANFALPDARGGGSGPAI